MGQCVSTACSDEAWLKAKRGPDVDEVLAGNVQTYGVCVGGRERQQRECTCTHVSRGSAEAEWETRSDVCECNGSEVQFCSCRKRKERVWNCKTPATRFFLLYCEISRPFAAAQP